MSGVEIDLPSIATTACKALAKQREDYIKSKVKSFWLKTEIRKKILARYVHVEVGRLTSERQGDIIRIGQIYRLKANDHRWENIFLERGI